MSTRHGLLSPFAGLYEPGRGWVYIAMNGLLFLPIYLLAGFALGRALRIDTAKKSLIIGASAWAAVLTALFAAACIFDDHSGWMMYYWLNVPHGWTLMEISRSSDYASMAGLLFTIAPPAVFALGVYLQKKFLKKKIDKADG